MEQTTQEHLLADELELNLELASSGKRLANYLIDVALFYIVFIFGIGFLAALTEAEWLLAFEEPSGGMQLLDRLISMVFYGLFLGVIEAISGGRTLGKLITGTRAVNEDGTRISAATAFKRGLSRAVPFCAFSALGSPCYPWQDKWTDTYVVDVKKSILPAAQQ